ncbi:MAG: tetratricopeptide repeat protein [Ignavibacteriaceae bacterium]
MREYRYFLSYSKFILLLLFVSGCSDSPKDLREKADKLYITAQDYYTRGYLKNAEELFSEVIELEKELKLSDKKADCYLYLGLIASENSDFKSAEKNYEIARDLFRKKFDRKGVGMVENNLGNIFANLGYINKALDYYRAALLTGQLSADKEGEAIAQMNIGSLYLENKEFKKAFDYFNKAFDNYQIIGNLDGELSATVKIGESFFRYGSLTDALDAFKQGYDLAEEISQKGSATEILNFMGMIYAKSGNLDDALTILNSAVLQAQKNDDPGMESAILANIGDVHTMRFDYPSAIKNYSDAIEKSGLAGNGLENLYLKLKLAKSIYNRGVWDENKKYIQNSKDVFEDLIEISEDIDDKSGAINSRSGLMICNFALGEYENAYEGLREILSSLDLYSSRIKNRYSENMLLPPQVFNYNDLYKVLLRKNNNPELLRTAFKFTQYQIIDFLDALNSIEHKETSRKKLFDSLQINNRETEFLSTELFNELSKESKYQNSDKVNHIKKQLAQKDSKFRKQYRDILKKIYLLDKYDLKYLQSKLDNKSALIAFLSVDDSLNIFLVDKQNIKLQKTLLTQTVLAGQIKMLSDNLVKSNAETLEPILRGLYQSVFKGLEQNLSGYSKLYYHILNDQSTELNYIPFHALIDGNNQMMSSKFSTGYFGGFKETSKYESGFRENILVYDSSAVKVASKEITLLKSSNANKLLILNKSIENLFLFSDSYMSLSEPNNSYLKISQGNETEYDIRVSELNQYSISSIHLFNFFSDNSSSMRLLSYITPGITSMSVLPFNLQLNIKSELVNYLMGVQVPPKSNKSGNVPKIDIEKISLFKYIKL